MKLKLPNPASATLAALLSVRLLGAGTASDDNGPEPVDLDTAANRYINLSLALSAIDPHFVASFYGDARVREQALATPMSLREIADRARDTAAGISLIESSEDRETSGRREFLQAQLASVAVRADLL